jgi:hypothetical protein
LVKNDSGQLFTIEGFAAALIMIMTAYLVVNATSVYTAGDTHINDMQLEAMGTDALNMMDISPNQTDAKTPLQQIIEAPTVDSGRFKTMFLNYTNESGSGPIHDIQFNASYTCRNSDNSTKNIPIISSRNLTGGEHTVRATKLVIVNKNVCGTNLFPVPDRAVLVEVLLWRD